MALTCLIAGKIVACAVCPLVIAYLYSVERDGPHKWFRSMLAEFAAALFNQVHSHSNIRLILQLCNQCAKCFLKNNFSNIFTATRFTLNG